MTKTKHHNRQRKHTFWDRNFRNFFRSRSSWTPTVLDLSSISTMNIIYVYLGTEWEEVVTKLYIYIKKKTSCHLRPPASAAIENNTALVPDFQPWNDHSSIRTTTWRLPNRLGGYRGYLAPFTTSTFTFKVNLSKFLEISLLCSQTLSNSLSSTSQRYI